MNNADVSVLIVEDDEDLRKSIEIGFKRQDFKVFTASNGIEALKQANENKIDAIITDIRMPKMNGSELIDQIKAKNDDHPIIFCISGHSDLKISESFNKGVDAFFQKPVSYEDLISATKHFVSSRNYIENIEQLLKGQENKIMLLNLYSSLGQNIHTIAKEMNEPLNIIGTSITLLKNILAKDNFSELRAKKADQYCTQIMQKTEEVISMLDSIHHITDAHSTKQKQSVSIQKIIADSLIRIKIESLKNHIDVNMKEIPAHCEIMCHPAQLCQALSNILFNAVDATKNLQDPKIMLEMKVTSHKVLIAIENNGPMIPIHIRSKIFEPFFTTKGVTSQNRTGIGLTISKQIIESHGGKIEVYSNAHRTRFIVSLPLKLKD